MDFKILISEDEKINLFLLEKFIEKSNNSNVVICHALDGEQAVELCDSSINLVLMDVEMPIMDGFEAATIIKAKYPSMPIVMQTAHCSQSHKEKAEAIGCDGFLSKPIIRKDLEELLSKYAPKN